jgi:hypothetical protein
MITIRQKIEIPENHTIHLEVKVPLEIPQGLAEIWVMVSPSIFNSPTAEVLKYAGCLQGVWEIDGLAIQEEIRNEWEKIPVRYQRNH